MRNIEPFPKHLNPSLNVNCVDLIASKKGYVTMIRRKVKLKTPTIFSVRIKPENLKKLKDIEYELALDNRNLTLNYMIETYYLYLIHKPFIDAIRKMIRGELRT